MAVDLNNALANALLDRYDTEFPLGSVVELRTGSPAGAENAAGGTLLGSYTLVATPWNPASGGTKTKNGTWTVTGAAAASTGTNIGHYRMRNAADTRREEGTVTVTGGGGDMTVDNVNIAQNQVLTINTFTKGL